MVCSGVPHSMVLDSDLFHTDATDGTVIECLSRHFATDGGTVGALDKLRHVAHGSTS